MTPKWENKNFLTLPKGNNMELRFGYSNFGNKDRLDIRQWVKAEDSGKMIPTKSGISVGKTASYKKAVVTLAEGEVIDFYSNI